MATSFENSNLLFAIFFTYIVIKATISLTLGHPAQDVKTMKFNIHFTHADENGIVLLSEGASENFILGLIELESSAHNLENTDCFTDSEHVVARRAGKMLFKIELNGRVDRENQTEFVVSIYCSYGHTHRTKAETFTVRVLDANDNPPVFYPSVYSVNITEGVDVGHLVVRVEAHDVDLGRNAKFKYSLSGFAESNDSSFAFKIDPDNGDIVINMDIDREDVAVHTLMVLATDQGVPPMTGTARVVITITDVNDNAPVIQTKELHVRENKPAQSVVGTLRAVDGDTGENAEIIFIKVNMSENVPTNPFLLNVNGQVLTADRLDREKRSQYSLVVAVKDKGSPQHSSTSTITITVDDANDNAPEVTSPCLSFGEDFIMGESDCCPGDVNANGSVVIDMYCPQNDTIIYQVVAVDEDIEENAALVYSLESVDNGRRRPSDELLFKINESTGVVSLRRCAYRGEDLVHTLRVRVSDSGLPRKSAVCFLNVTLDIDPLKLPYFKNAMNTGDSRFSLMEVVLLLFFTCYFLHILNNDIHNVPK